MHPSRDHTAAVAFAVSFGSFRRCPYVDPRKNGLNWNTDLKRKNLHGDTAPIRSGCGCSRTAVRVASMIAVVNFESSFIDSSLMKTSTVMNTAVTMSIVDSASKCRISFLDFRG